MAIVCTTTLGALRADYCTPGTAFGRVDFIYLSRVGDDFTDWTSPAEWATRISNSTAQPGSGDYYVRFLHVIGSLAEPAQNEIEIPLGRKAFSPPDFTIPFRVYDVGTLNYAFMDQLIDSNGGIYSAWIQTGTTDGTGGYLYGGNTGIIASVKLNYSIPESNKELITINGSLLWTGSMPERITSPI